MLAVISALIGETFVSDFATWRALVEKDLAGASFEKLVHRTPEDIAIEPVYTEWQSELSLPGAPPYVRGAYGQSAAIGLCIRVDGDRTVATEEIDGGATALWLDVDNDGALEVAAAAHADLVVDIAKSIPTQAIELLAHSKAEAWIWISIDPITAAIQGVTPPETLVAEISHIPSLANNACEQLSNTRPLRVSTTSCTQRWCRCC